MPPILMPKATNLEAIKNKVLAFHTKMNAIINHVNKTDKKNLHIDKQTQFLQFYIDKESLKRLNQMSKLENFDSFVVLFGFEDSERLNKLTACILGADVNKNILPQHKGPYKSIKGTQEMAFLGEESFPPPPNNGVGGSAAAKFIPPTNCLTLKSSKKQVEDFFS